MKRFKIKIVGLLFCVTSLLAAGREPLPHGTGSPDSIILYDSWQLWLDEKAEWQHDKLYLPDEVDLTKLPANPDGFQPATAKQIIYNALNLLASPTYL